MTSIEDNRSENSPEDSRRRLVKRLALVAATGYLAPQAMMISGVRAGSKPSKPSKPSGISVPSAPSCKKGKKKSGPFC